VTRTGPKPGQQQLLTAVIGMVSDITDPAHPVPVGLYYISFIINFTPGNGK